MLAPETVLQGRYRIVGQLGQGGMGAVYEAIDERLDTIVALKETLFTDERLRKQFEREARLLARLHHPALPRVSDHFNEGEGEFLVMQFIAGDDLSAMLAQRKGPFPVAEVLKWADQLLDALDYLHTQDPQIVHRDIKPQNLKLTARGQIVLLDFGLAKGSVGQMSVVTTSASIYGYTPNYAPLEQVQGLGTDPRSDLYSLSATIYHLTTGVKPPDALTRAAAIVNGQTDPLQPANQVALQINSAVAGVLAKAMAQNREQRYVSANQMRDALRLAADSAATVSNDEAATVLLPGAVVSATARTIASEQAATLAAERRTAMGTKPQVASSAETVTRIHVPDSRRGSGIWKPAAVALVLLACAGVFYGYRVIRNRTQANEIPTASPTSDLNVKPQPIAAPSTAAPIVTESATEPGKKTNSTASATQRAASAKVTAPKNPAVAAQNSNQAQRDEPLNIPPVPNVDAGHPPTTNAYPEPRQFPVNPNMPDDRAGRGRARMRGGVMVRTLPDGTQIVTQPDGTRIVRRPNGATRVFGPGEKLNRKPFRP